MAKMRGITRLTLCHQPRAIAGEARNLVLGPGRADGHHGPAGTAADFRQCVERRFRRAKPVEQLPKSYLSDGLGADQPEPGNALGRCEHAVHPAPVHHPAFLLPPMVGSVPLSSRPIFSRCWKNNSNDRPATTRARRSPLNT